MKTTERWLSPADSQYLAFLRSVSIMFIIIGHLGGWIFPPWSNSINLFVPIFFFISGVVSYNAYLSRSSTARYLAKRCIKLLVPYYGIVIFSLLIFAIYNNKIPDFSFLHIYEWIFLIAKNKIMPFPLGQVWFIHTLLIIILFSPCIFYLYNNFFNVFIFAFSTIILLSINQMHFSINEYLFFCNHNFAKPLFHSIFFCLGFITFDHNAMKSSIISFLILLSGVCVSTIMVVKFNVSPNYSHHTSSMDFFYIIGGASLAFFFISIERKVNFILNNMPIYIDLVLDFIFNHTYSIFLLHSFAIFFVEKEFGLIHPSEKTAGYAILKFSSVVTVTFILAPVLTNISSFVSSKLLFFFKISKNQHGNIQQ